MTRRRADLPMRRSLLAFVSLTLIATAIAARADNGIVDVGQLPRLPAAQDDPHSRPDRIVYIVPGVVRTTIASVQKLMADNGWVQYVQPLSDYKANLLFKKGAQGVFVTFTQALGRPDQSAVHYTANRIYADVPFPAGATDIVFDERRPFLGCTAPGNVDANLEFYRREFTASGWIPLSADDAKARWPNAVIDDKIEHGARAYFRRDDRDRQLPIMVSLQRRDDTKTAVDVRVAPFALPQNLGAGPDSGGLPRPDHVTSAGSSGDTTSDHREVHATVIAEMPAVLAFYRRELTSRGWKEETRGASITPDEVTLNFTSPDETGTLKLGHKYDLALASFATQVSPEALAARVRAKKDGDDKFMKDAMSTATALIAADNVRRTQQASTLSDAPLHAQAVKTSALPVPEGAENVAFDGAEGRLEFKSSSSVAALAAFYRSALKPLGWKEQPAVINNPNMAAMEFSADGKKISITALQMGPKVSVSAHGSGLEMANAKPDTAGGRPPVKAAPRQLEADPDSALPVPKEHTMSSIAAGKLPGSDIPFRRELEASIPADLASVLAFYRNELGKRGWKEAAERTLIKPDHVQLAFTSPDGPAALRLGRKNDETTVNLALKIPAVAAKSEVLPKPGQARLLLGNLGDAEASITINKQTVAISAGAGGPHTKGPTLDLPPGKYQYAVRVAGHPARNNTIEVGADDAWGLMIAPDGDTLALHVY
jgi:hypothetical protein